MSNTDLKNLTEEATESIKENVSDVNIYNINDKAHKYNKSSETILAEIIYDDLNYHKKNTEILNKVYHEIIVLVVKYKCLLGVILLILVILASLGSGFAERLLRYMFYMIGALLAFPTVKGFRRFFNALINRIDRWNDRSSR